MRSPWPLFVCFICICTTCIMRCVADDEYGHEFVDEVLSDDAEHYASDFDMFTTDTGADRHAQQEKDRQRLLREREAEQREREFEAKVAQMRDADARKAALRKKKRDAKIVQQVLNAHEAENLYGVLGLLNNRYLRLPKRIVTIIPKYFTVELPEVNLLYATHHRIKRAYRERAKQTHPDKNSDGRAVQAFWALDQAAEVLMNPDQRKAYDKAVRLRRRERRRRLRSMLQEGLDRVFGVGRRGVEILRTLLGPFFVPFSMLFVLMF